MQNRREIADFAFDDPFARATILLRHIHGIAERRNRDP